MDDLSNREKNAVFLDQLHELKDKEYITESEYARLRKAQWEYLTADQSVHKVEKQGVERKGQNLEKKSKPKPAPVKKKKERSPEEIRERNITWTLILGVSILLITGLIVATSQWDQMGAITKVVSISGVSLFFFAMSYGTGRMLKIKQTAFAFLTLGSLLIPIVIVAIGYFELFGPSLSLYGEGRYLLGLMGTAIPLPLYIRHAFAHRSRLYVWIAFLFLSLGVGFLLGALPLSLDAFYLGLMLYNAGVLAVYIKVKANQSVQLFIREVPLFAQLNLILSTLLMLFFYENEVFYSFNLLLTASVYMAMVFVYKTREYQFVFSVMIAYGVYQLVEHSPLHAVNSIVYALVGLFYIGFAYAFKNHSFIEKVFRFTSGIVSFLAFLYITYESLLLKDQASSWLLLAAYFIIMINYLVLANIANYTVFAYLTSVFFFISTYQLWDLIQTGPWFFFLFTAASLLFLYAGMWTTLPWMRNVKGSSFYTSVVVMCGCLYYALYDLQYGYSALMLIMVSVLAYFLKKNAAYHKLHRTAVWVLPTGLAASSIVVYQSMMEWFPASREDYTLSLHLALTGGCLLALHYGWKKWKESEWALSTFYTAQGTYGLAMLLLLIDTRVDPVLVRPLILLAGIGMMCLLVRFTNKRIAWSLVSIVSLAFYVSLLETFGMDSFSHVLLYMLFAPVWLIAIGQFGKKKGWGLRPHFYLLGHIVQPIIVLFVLLDQLGPENIHPVYLIIPLGVYIYSTLNAEKESGIKTMLYAALINVYLLLVTLVEEYGLWKDSPYEYGFLASSLLYAMLWIFLPSIWKKRIEWYIIPFSLLGLFAWVQDVPLRGEGEWVLGIGYTVFNLFFLHRRPWSLVRFIPLVLTISLWERLSIVWGDSEIILSLVLVSLALLGVGKVLHGYLIGPGVQADAYTWSALLYIGYLSIYAGWEESVWIRILPLILLSMWFYLSGSKWPDKVFRNICYTGASGCLYGSYLMVIAAYSEKIPDLMMAELQALPALLVLFFVGKYIWEDSPVIVGYVHLAVLLLIAGYLVIDAIQSHTVWDAWIIGGLSLLSMIAGMQLRIKSYFLVGMGVLVFNILYQTRPYWGNVPWWVYLLLAGLVLIGIASYNEWQKQRSESDKSAEKKVKRIWEAFKKWK